MRISIKVTLMEFLIWPMYEHYNIHAPIYGNNESVHKLLFIEVRILTPSHTK